MASARQELDPVDIQLLVDSIPALIHTARPDGYLDYFNHRWLEYLGVALDKVAGWNWTAFIHPEDVDGIVAQWRACLESGEDFACETRVRRAGGEYRWMLHRKVPIRNANGQIVKWYGSSMDIDESKTAEEQLSRNAQELQRSEFYLAEGQRLAHMGSWAFDRGGFSYWSPELFRILGLEPAGHPPGVRECLDLVHPHDRESVAELIAGVLAKASPFDATKRIVRPGGEVRYIRCVGAPVFENQGLKGYIGSALDVTGHELLTQELRRREDRLRSENVALREEIDKASMFEEIVGRSPSLKVVLSRVSKVAPSDSTVLITGETGTGKELVARAIHRRSERAPRVFVSVNCAAIPRDLIASELFGHEKGAFTGATQQRLGRFELANGGTLFLDEVGELPAETQIALLRVLQEHEFERIGGNRRIRSDVRVITATNRDLPAAISSGSFRSDLFYRLNVFPIEMPSLRERREDIPLLVEYFIDRYARKIGKNIKRVSKKTLDLLQSYPWPGNIRELQNVIERSMILCETEIFSIDENWLPRQSLVIPVQKQQVELPQRLLAQEKDMIEVALKASRGRVSGLTGAAAKLGIPRSTLESKIKALKIDKNRFRTVSEP